MTMKYFRLTDDVHYPERWHLGEVEEIDNWALVSTTLPAETSGNFSVKIYRPGREMDFTMNAIFSVPIVSGAFKDALAHLPGLRFLPARIEETTASRQFFLMVVDDEVDAVDESRSELQKYLVADDVRPSYAAATSRPVYFKASPCNTKRGPDTSASGARSSP